MRKRKTIVAAPLLATLLVTVIFASTVSVAKPNILCILTEDQESKGVPDAAKARAPTGNRSKRPVRISRQGSYQELDLFEAMKNDQIGVLIVPRDFSILKMSIRNKTDSPLLIRAPEVFAAIPAQRAMNGQERASSSPHGTRSGYGQQSSQALGGSFYQPDPKVQSAARRNSADGSQADEPLADEGDSRGSLPKWLIRPGKIVSHPVRCFCLEFGRPDPTPRVPYLLRPLTELTNGPTVRDLLIQFNRHQCSQRVTQLAVWHVGNKVPWQTLAMAQLPRSMAGRNRTFSAREMRAARDMVESLPEQ